MTPERLECLERLARLILLIDRPHPVRVAIDGPDAAGKTTLADELVPVIEAAGRQVVRASIDGFHKPRAARLARGPESPEGYFYDSFDYAALRSALLAPLGRGGDGRYRRRIFDYRTDRPESAPTEVAPANSVLLFDGVFLLRRELIDAWDFRVFVEVDLAETQRRGVARDAALFGSEAQARQRYEARYVPGQRLYYSQDDPLAAADVVVENGDPAAPRLRFREPG